MHILSRAKSPARLTTMGFVVLGILFLGMTSCKSSHDPRPTEETLDRGFPEGNDVFHQASYGRLKVAVQEVPGAELVNDDELCMTCHEAYTNTFQHNVHRGDSCESCHGPASRHLETRGTEPGLIFNFKTARPAERSEVCLKCHEESQCDPGAKFRFSKHAHCGVSCTDCHTSHYNVPRGTPATTEPGGVAVDATGNRVALTSYQNPAYTEVQSLRGSSNNLGAVAPGVCFNCHGNKRQFAEIAGPHQIGGPNGFNCTTCHDPHGKITEYGRMELCLQCHIEGSPTMAYHSSTHYLQGVACTDCHNPHPDTRVARLVNISHTNVQRTPKLPMSVDEPNACYKCHPRIFGMNALPSHHPIKEGKMTCSDCHDGHGQTEGNLKSADRTNDLCYKCHAEKQGPFAFEHPPVTEDCGICHNPHGTVANNLLKQPTTFLCLRCHTGHRERHGSNDINGDANAQNQLGFYTDCTQCHSQIHGSNLPSPWVNGKRHLMR